MFLPEFAIFIIFIKYDTCFYVKYFSDVLYAKNRRYISLYNPSRGCPVQHHVAPTPCSSPRYGSWRIDIRRPNFSKVYALEFCLFMSILHALVIRVQPNLKHKIFSAQRGNKCCDLGKQYHVAEKIFKSAKNRPKLT